MVFSICMTELSRIHDNLFLVLWTLLLQLICCLWYDPTIFIINYSDITHFDSLLGHVSTPYVCILKRTIDETLQANYNWILKKKKKKNYFLFGSTKRHDIFRIQGQAMCTRYNIMWWSLSVTCGRSVDFSWYSGFLHQWNWPLRYSWNVVESGVKHHNPNPRIMCCICL